jgi:hypothetical protein
MVDEDVEGDETNGKQEGSCWTPDTSQTYL